MSAKNYLCQLRLIIGVLAVAPLWAQSPFTVSCPTAVAPGTDVVCSLSLAPTSGVTVTSLSVGILISPGAGAPDLDQNTSDSTYGVNWDGAGTPGNFTGTSNLKKNNAGSFLAPSSEGGGYDNFAVAFDVTSGTITGFPLVGYFDFWVPATAAANQTYSVSFTQDLANTGLSPSTPISVSATGTSISIIGTVTITAPAAGALVPGATIGTAYTQTFTAAGGNGTYNWTINTGSLPTGLTFASTGNHGVISGTPGTATSGAFSNIVVTATDTESTPLTTSQTYTLQVNPALGTISPATLASGSVSTAYSQTLTVTGGSTMYTWTATGLPAGLSITSPTALGQTTISGTPTASASAVPVSVTVKDADGATSMANYTLTIGGPLALAPATGATLATGTVGYVYTTGTTIAASGGTPSYHFTATGLPGGLGINASTGAITGTPTVSGTFSAVMVTVTDSATPTASSVGPFTYTIVIDPAITLTAPASLPNGTTGVAYPSGLSFSATGGSGNYSWTVTGLPGVSFGTTTTGTPVTLTGAPSAPSTGDTVTVTVTDSTYPTVTASKVYTNVVIAQGVSINLPATGALANATVGFAYSASITSQFGTAPYVWTISSGTLPAGLGITSTGTNGATGLISGTPTGTPGLSTFTVQVQDTNGTGSLATRAYTITVYTPPSLTTATLPVATVGSSYNAAATNPITLAGGAPTVTWSVTPSLPSGLSISPTTGAITGTPAAGTNTGSPYSLTIKVTDASGATATANASLTVDPALTVTPTTLTIAIPSVAYSVKLTAGGGSGTGYTFSQTGLPNTIGLTFSSGTLSGTPTTQGSYPLVVTLTDSTGASAKFNYTLVVAPPLSINGPASLPAGLIGAAYSAASPSAATVTATGGSTPYSFTATGLPPGLSISSGGLISGSPTAVAGSPFSVTVTVKDNNGTTANKSYTIAISALPLTLTGGPVPTGVVNVPYPPTSFGVAGGVGPYSWSITGLPPGLTTDGNGDISGTPTTATGSPFSVVVKVTDSTLTSVSKTFSVTINSTLSVMAPTTLPAANLNTAYLPVTVTAGGGLPPYTWTATGLPTGMSIAVATGIISGTPTTAAGTPYSVTVTVTDSTGKTASMTYTLAVSSVLTLTGPASLPNGTVGAAYPGATVGGSGGSGVYTFSATGLPSGLIIGSTTGAISGTPAAGTAGTDTVVVTVTDSSSNTATKTYTLTINPGPSSLPIITSVSANTEGQSIIGPNTWVSIYGSNFAAANFTDTWTKTILASSTGALPIILDGVSVMIGGVPAYVDYISAIQINVLAPNIGFGPLQVTVTTGGGTSNAVTITSQQNSPGIFEWPVAPGGTVNQPVATHLNYTYAAANGSITGLTTVPAAPGETIIIWGSGFGPTSPANPFGVAVPSTPTFTSVSNVTVSLNSIPLAVYQNVAVLTASVAGEFQIAVTLPATIANGSYPIVTTIGGVSSPPLMLTVAAPVN